MEKSWGNGPVEESAVTTALNVTGSLTVGERGCSETERMAQSVEGADEAGTMEKGTQGDTAPVTASFTLIENEPTPAALAWSAPNES